MLDELGTAPTGVLSGTPLALGPSVVLNAEDFVYDARFSSDAKSFAFSRLGLKGYALSVFDLTVTPPVRRADALVNTYEFDVEMIEFTPDGTLVATVSRDGSVRLFDAVTGAARAAWLTDEPLVSVAIHPSGRSLVVGSAAGLLTVLSLPDLVHVSETRGHSAEVRGLAFAADGRLYSGGWDKRIATWSLTESNEPAWSVRAHVERVNGLLVFRSVVAGRASARTTIDARLPMTVIQGALAQAAGIDVPALTETTTIATAFGNQLVKVARGQRLSVKGLTFENVEVAICDACVPPGTHAVLGASLLARFDFATDDTTHEVVLTMKPAGPPAQPEEVRSQRVVALTSAGPAFVFEAFVNDLTLDAVGSTLGVAFSGTKAERNREVYEREKRGEPAPADGWNCGAFVDAATGTVLEKHPGNAVVATAGISPDGRSMLFGAWDKVVALVARGQPARVDSKAFGWAVRRTRFSRDGRWVAIASWTPQNPLGNHQSDPSAVIAEVLYGDDVRVRR